MLHVFLDQIWTFAFTKNTFYAMYKMNTNSVIILNRHLKDFIVLCNIAHRFSVFNVLIEISSEINQCKIFANNYDYWHLIIRSVIPGS